MNSFFNVEEEITFVISEILEQKLWLQKVYQFFYAHPFIRGMFCVNSTFKDEKTSNIFHLKLSDIANQVGDKQKRVYFLDLLRRYLGNIQKALEHEKKDRQVETIKKRLRKIDALFFFFFIFFSFFFHFLVEKPTLCV